MAGKKIPMRMCVGCRQMRPENEIKLDRTGKASGRGAYICPAVECLEKAQKIRALERALEHKVEPEVFERLGKEIIGRE